MTAVHASASPSRQARTRTASAAPSSRASGRERRTGSSQQADGMRRVAKPENAVRGTTRNHNGRCTSREQCGCHRPAGRAFHGPGAQCASPAISCATRAPAAAQKKSPKSRTPPYERRTEVPLAVIRASSNVLTRGGTISTLRDGDPHMRDRTTRFLGSLVLATAAAAWLATGPLAAQAARPAPPQPAKAAALPARPTASPISAGSTTSPR
jgi:hypothetical protein